MRRTASVVLLSILIIFVGSGSIRAESKTTTGVYTKVKNPSELGLDLDVRFHFMVVTPDEAGSIRGKVMSLTVWGRELALTSSEIVNDQKGSWIVTKAYGRIKLSAGSYPGTVVLWLTPSQRASFKALKRSSSN